MTEREKQELIIAWCLCIGKAIIYSQLILLFVAMVVVTLTGAH